MTQMAKGIPFLIKKRDILYLQKRVPKKLVPTIGRQFVQLSLRTKDKATAIRTAGIILSAEKLAIEKSWIFKMGVQATNIQFLSKKVLTSDISQN